MEKINFSELFTREFPESLGLARKIENFCLRDHSPRETAILAGEVRDYYKTVLAKRFKGEKALASTLQSRFGTEDPGVGTLRENHRTLEKLSRSKDMDGLYHFSHKLKAYVYFETDDLFPRIERILNDGEKAELAARLSVLTRLNPKAA